MKKLYFILEIIKIVALTILAIYFNKWWILLFYLIIASDIEFKE